MQLVPFHQEPTRHRFGSMTPKTNRTSPAESKLPAI